MVQDPVNLLPSRYCRPRYFSTNNAKIITVIPATAAPAPNPAFVPVDMLEAECTRFGLISALCVAGIPEGATPAGDADFVDLIRLLPMVVCDAVPSNGADFGTNISRSSDAHKTLTTQSAATNGVVMLMLLDSSCATNVWVVTVEKQRLTDELKEYPLSRNTTVDQHINSMKWSSRGTYEGQQNEVMPSEPVCCRSAAYPNGHTPGEYLAEIPLLQARRCEYMFGGKQGAIHPSPGPSISRS